MSMPPLNPNIDLNRRRFIKTSLVLAGAFFLGKVSGLLPLTSKIAPATSATEEYQNDRYGFSLMHPSYMKISTIDEGSGASTITFQNVEKGEGFQISIAPHSEPHAGEVPFNGINGIEKSDESYGVRESLTPITVDGAFGDAFYSTHTTLGATREIRIIHNGFLYELTTLAPLDTHLESIIKTWKFA